MLYFYKYLKISDLENILKCFNFVPTIRKIADRVLNPLLTI